MIIHHSSRFLFNPHKMSRLPRSVVAKPLGFTNEHVQYDLVGHASEYIPIIIHCWYVFFIASPTLAMKSWKHSHTVLWYVPMYIYIYTYIWGFHRWGYPKNGWFTIGTFHLEMDADWGGSPILRTPPLIYRGVVHGYPPFPTPWQKQTHPPTRACCRSSSRAKGVIHNEKKPGTWSYRLHMPLSQ